MTEESFNDLVNRAPQDPTEIGELKRIGNFLRIPGWVFNSDREYLDIPTKRVKRQLKNLKSEDILVGVEEVYHFFISGSRTFESIPTCLCGKPLRVHTVYRASKSCGNPECNKKQIAETIKELWTRPEYRKRLSKSQKDWSAVPENRRKRSEISKKAWQKPGYKERMSLIHVQWAAVPENKEKMSECSKKLWQSPGYRKRMSQAHLDWIEKNPDKVRCWNQSAGSEKSKKSRDGVLKYDSSWEQDFINFCNKSPRVIQIERASIWIPYKTTDDGKSRRYIPDFNVRTIKGELILVEIKPKRGLGTDPRFLINHLKIKAAEKYVKNSLYYRSFLLLTEEDLYVDGIVRKKTRVINTGKLENLLLNQ